MPRPQRNLSSLLRVTPFFDPKGRGFELLTARSGFAEVPMRGGMRVSRAALSMLALVGFLGPGSGSALAGKIVETEKKLYSFGNEELIIRDFFNDRRDGVFLDVGAFHYKMVSSTYYLEEHLGWSGIAVDALAEFAIGYIQHRPRTRFFNFWSRTAPGRSARSTACRATTRACLPRAPGGSTPGWRRFGQWFPEGRGRDRQEAGDLSDDHHAERSPRQERRVQARLRDHEYRRGRAEGAGRVRHRALRARAGAGRCLGNKQELLAYFDAHGYDLIRDYRKYAHKKNCYFKPRR